MVIQEQVAGSEAFQLKMKATAGLKPQGDGLGGPSYFYSHSPNVTLIFRI